MKIIDLYNKYPELNSLETVRISYPGSGNHTHLGFKFTCPVCTTPSTIDAVNVDQNIMKNGKLVCHNCAKSKTTNAFLRRFPELEEVYKERKYFGEGKSRQLYVHIRCSECGEYPKTTRGEWSRWSPNVIDQYNSYGRFICYECHQKHWRDRGHATEARMEAWRTIVKNNPGFKVFQDPSEDTLIWLMKEDPIRPDMSAHHAPKAIAGIYEADGYSPKYHKMFECDEEKGHTESPNNVRHTANGAPLGYHNKKDQLAESQGDLVFHYSKEYYDTHPEYVEETFLAWYRYGTESVSSPYDTVS